MDSTLLRKFKIFSESLVSRRFTSDLMFLFKLLNDTCSQFFQPIDILILFYFLTIDRYYFFKHKNY